MAGIGGRTGEYASDLVLTVDPIALADVEARRASRGGSGAADNVDAARIDAEGAWARVENVGMLLSARLGEGWRDRRM